METQRPMAEELDAQLNVKMPKRLLTTLRDIERQHGITPADQLRRLAEEMATFFDQHGWFSFPVRILPEAEIAKRIKPITGKIDIWSLNPNDAYTLTGDEIIQDLLDQLGIPNLFASAAEHDEVRMMIAFDNHPTHWLQFDFFKGSSKPGGDGLAFNATPKTSTNRAEMLQRLQSAAKKMGASKPFAFSQIPMLEKRRHSAQQATTAQLSS